MKKSKGKSGGGSSIDTRNAEQSSAVGGRGTTGAIDASGAGSGKGGVGTMAHMGELKKHVLHGKSSKY